MTRKITQTAGRDQLGVFAPLFARLNDDVLFGEVWNEEGLQTVQNLARNMAFMIKAIKAGKESVGKPEMKHDSWTHFIR